MIDRDPGSRTIGPLGNAFVRREQVRRQVLVSGGLFEAIYASTALSSGAVTLVIFEPVFGRIPGGQTAVLGEAYECSVAAVEPA